jgi:hypothetical protein
MAKKSGIDGRGLFLQTSKAIRENTVIALVKGSRLPKRTKRMDYTIELGNCFLEPDEPFKYINSSVEQNCELQKWWSDDGEPEEVAIVSRAKIKPIKN